MSDARLLAELAADCFAAARFCPSEAEIGAEYLAAAVAATEKTNVSKDALAATAGNSAPRQRKPRRPSISKLLEEAEKAGKPVTSITLPDGTKLDFDKPDSATADNPWLTDLHTRETKQ
jgi:hypothetical protein